MSAVTTRWSVRHRITILSDDVLHIWPDTTGGCPNSGGPVILAGVRLARDPLSVSG